MSNGITCVEHVLDDMNPTKDKQTLKILCLHGYRQSKDSFKSKSGGFRKLFKNRLEFVFIEAPHTVPIGDQNPEGEDLKGWWFSGTDPDYFHSSHESDICNGFDQSLDLIKNTFETQGPFDGVLGFSQGATMAAIIACLKTLNEFDFDLKFVCLISGFKSLSKRHLEFIDRLEGRLINIPSLHIIGETDQIIAKSKSEHLMEYFENPLVVYHSGGHLIPSNSTNRQKFNEFFERFL